MVEVEDPILVDRSVPFVPDEIFFLNFVATDYTPIPPTPEDYAELEFELQL